MPLVKRVKRAIIQKRNNARSIRQIRLQRAQEAVQKLGYRRVRLIQIGKEAAIQKAGVKFHPVEFADWEAYGLHVLERTHVKSMTTRDRGRRNRIRYQSLRKLFKIRKR